MSVAERQVAYEGDHISPRNFDLLAKFIYAYSGIKMPQSKLTMLEGRLRRRLKATGYGTFDDYCDFLFKGDGIDQETIFLIDAVTTNKTDFFREPKHFEFMEQIALPDLLAQGHRKLRIWSSACSTGAEPYTIAMVMQEYALQLPNLSYTVISTDLSTEVLQIGRQAIYSEDMMTPVPPALRKKYVMNAVDPSRREVRIVPRLRSQVAFGRLNLMDDQYNVGAPMQIIFCRNVLIYFDKKTQAHVLSRLCDALMPGGYLFIGHSESIVGADLPVKQVANTVFQRL